MVGPPTIAGATTSSLSLHRFASVTARRFRSRAHLSASVLTGAARPQPHNP